jgi:hypothetical protein
MSEPNGNGARFSLAALAASSKETKIQTATAKAGADNPFLDQVRSSHEQDKRQKDSGWREVEVPSSMLDELIASMRSLSAWFGENDEKIGVHLRIEFHPDNEPDPDKTIEVGPGRFDEIPRDGRTVWFKYTGRDRMKRGRRRSAPAQQPAAGLATEPTEPTDVEVEEDSELQPA